MPAAGSDVGEEEPRPLRVGLLWHSVNQSNLGVGALTAANIAIIEEASQRLGVPVEFVVLGWFDSCERAYIVQENLRMQPLRGRDFLPGGQLRRTAQTCDLVFDIGAGDSFADIYGWKRFAYMAASKWLVLRAGCPLILSPQTLGPFRGHLARLLTSYLIRRATQVFARDRQSIDALNVAGLQALVRESVDVAFRLPYTPPAPTVRSAEVTRFGFNVSALLYRGQGPFGLACDYADLTHRLLSHFSMREHCHLVLVPHVLSASAHEDDYRLSETLAAEYPGVSVAPRFCHPSEAKSFIASMDFFAGARMHACIAAFSTGVPVIPLAYSRKFSGLFGALGYDWLVDCAKVDAAAACAAVVDGFDRRAELAAAVAAGTRIVEAKLDIYETAVADALRAAAVRQGGGRWLAVRSTSL